MAEPKADEASLELFSSIPLFRGLESSELKEVVRLSKEASFEQGEAIVKKGEPGLGFYVILAGGADVRKGKETVAKLARGSFFGELALLDDQPRSADVIATSQTRCLVLLRWNFWSLVTKNSKVMRGLFQELARRLRATTGTLSE